MIPRMFSQTRFAHESIECNLFFYQWLGGSKSIRFEITVLNADDFDARIQKRYAAELITAFALWSGPPAKRIATFLNDFV